MSKNVVFGLIGISASMLGVGFALSGGLIVIAVLCALIFAVSLVFIIIEYRDIEQERWDTKRKISKMLNENEDKFDKIRKELRMKADKCPSSRVKPGKVQSETYRKMVAERDGRTED